MMLFTLLMMLVPVFIIFIFIPYWTRKTESFGISIPEELFYSNDLKQMRKKYAFQMTGLSILLTVLLIVSFFFTNDETMIGIIYSGIILAYIAVGFFIYLVFHRQMKRKKQTENWTKEKSVRTVVHTKFREQKLTVSNWLHVIPFFISLLTIFFTLMYYDKIPDKIAMNYDFSGEVTRWEAKTYGNVLFLPLTQLSLIILFVIINIVIAKSKQQVSAQDPDESMQRNVIFRWRWSLFMWVTSLLLTLMFTFIVAGEFFFNINETVMVIVPIAISSLVVIGSIILAITTGQGGSRISIQSDKDELVIDRDDDIHWKLGQFYFNKDDPTLFIEKRFGIGWTINHGRPIVWLSLIGLVVILALIALFVVIL